WRITPLGDVVGSTPPRYATPSQIAVTNFDAQLSLICGKINSSLLDIEHMAKERWSLATTTTRYSR
ncbi:MAG: hypothetical protein OEU92_31570, partial [Alphaproteobacteria bacterium]|nr:hypothetical protein [Alphaproteobacteria bacterium]